ncbi:venom allergen/ancylostoma secreted protein-like 8 isoform 1, partial [Aphelenchoides avenae]
MAHGQQPNKCGLLPGGKNIYKLDYNCTLEDQMYANIDCEKSTQGVTSVGGASPFSDEQAIKMMVNTYMGNWYTIVRLGRNETSVPKSWYQMAFGIIGQMGCALKMCPPTNTSSFYTVKYGCFYDVVPNGPAYEAGPVCKQDSDCTGRTHSKCLADEGLCHYSEAYPFESGPNEICPPGTGSPRIDDPARIAAVEVHNAYRSSLIHGKEPMGPDGALAPRGGNMYKM